MAFNTIGQKTVWNNWETYGAGAWNMWFMAPYGSWMYCGFSKNNISEFKKVYIGTDLLDYEISTWEFDPSAINTPDEVFPDEPYEGYPNGSMDLGCIHEGTGTYLYLMGHQNPAPDTTPIIRRFDLAEGFAEKTGLLGFQPEDNVSALLNINHICGLEIIPDDSIFVVTNNNDGNEFTLYKYAYIWDNAAHPPTVTKNLAVYIENNTQARIRGMSIAADGNILVFCNTGETSTSTLALKFNSSTLSYMGKTVWLDPNSISDSISTSIWAHMVLSGEVFLYFRGLDSTNFSERITQIFYDNSTGVPDSGNSNFVIANNLTSFGNDTAIELKYLAKDGFNNPVVSTNCKFVIKDVAQDDPTTWDATIGGIQPGAGDDFFDADNVPIDVHAIPATDANGEAVAYYKPMREGTGTFIDTINVFCPSDN